MESYDLVIVGGGPGGMTAGIFGKRLGLKVLLITKEFGGQMAKKTVPIENYPGFESISGLDLIERMKNQVLRFKVETKLDEVTKVEKENEEFLVLTKGGEIFKGKAVILATGASPRRLSVPGEKEFLGKGVSYCATCDGPFFKEKEVAVIGGGNAGFETAIYLAEHCKKIFILEAGEKVRADFENQKRAEETGKIEIITQAILKEIRGGDFVSEILYEDRKTKKEVVLAVSGVFIEIGQVPLPPNLGNLVEFNEKNEIVVDFKTFQTKTPGLFAIGDCNQGKYKQIVIACGQGATAALAAYDYLKEKFSS